MTYREFIRSGLPPAPEPAGLRRLRRLTMIASFAAALALIVVRSLDNRLLELGLMSLVGALVALSMLVVFLRHKVRHDLDYWTPERVALHQFAADIAPPDRPKAR